jgi:hypothetical protein
MSLILLVKIGRAVREQKHVSGTIHMGGPIHGARWDEVAGEPRPLCSQACYSFEWEVKPC